MVFGHEHGALVRATRSPSSIADSNTAKWRQLGGLGTDRGNNARILAVFATPPRAPSYLRLAVLLALLAGQPRGPSDSDRRAAENPVRRKKLSFPQRGLPLAARSELGRGGPVARSVSGPRWYHFRRGGVGHRVATCRGVGRVRALWPTVCDDAHVGRLARPTRRDCAVGECSPGRRLCGKVRRVRWRSSSKDRDVTAATCAALTAKFANFPEDSHHPPGLLIRRSRVRAPTGSLSPSLVRLRTLACKLARFLELRRGECPLSPSD